MTAQHDDIDERLREYAGRWQESVPVPRPGSLPLRRPARQSRPWMVTAAAVVAAALVAAIVLVAQVLGTDRRSVAPAVRPGQVVPWAPLPATHPKIPAVRTSSGPPLPDPTAAAAAPPCRAGQLRVRRLFGVGAGTQYIEARFRRAHGDACRLSGYPRVELLSNGRTDVIPVQRTRDSDTYRRPVLVGRGHVGVLRLGWSSDWCTTAVPNESIAVTLPSGGGTIRLRGFGESPACYGEPGSGKTAAFYSTFQPPDPGPVKVRSAYSTVKATSNLERAVRAEAPVHFVVTLSSDHRVVLDPCPDYSIVSASWPHGRRFALNCAAVPYRDGQDRPYLPADTPVRFAMQLPAVSASPQKVDWLLDTPGSRPTTFGILTLRQDGRPSRG